MSAKLENGARFQLKQKRIEEHEIHYHAEIELPGNTHYGFEVTITAASGDFQIQQETEAEMPSSAQWTNAYLLAITQQMIRKARKAEQWPRRLKFWKADP